MARGYFVLFDLLFVAVALSFYQFGASLSGYRNDMVQNGMFLAIVAVGLAVLAMQILRFVRRSSAETGTLDPIVVHFLTYGIMIVLVVFAGIAGLTLDNWQENKYLAAFVIAAVAAIAIFLEDLRSIEVPFRRRNRS